MGKYLPKKGKVHESNFCLKAPTIFADLPFFGKYFPYLPQSDEINSIYLTEICLYNHQQFKLQKSEG